MNHSYQLLLGAVISLSTFTGCMQDGAGQYRCSYEENELRGAICNYDNEQIEQLLEAGTNPNAQCDDAGHDATSLMHAAWRGQLEIVEQCLEQEKIVEGINLKDRHGDTALTYAFKTITEGNDESTKGRKEEIARLLINKGADPSIQNNFGKTPVMQAIESCYPNFLRWLIENKHIGVDSPTLERSKHIEWLNKGMTLAMCAAFWRREEMLSILINLGADLNKKDALDRTALMILVEDKLSPNSIKIAELLIENMTPEALGSRDAESKTAFMHLLGRENLGEAGVKIAELLINKMEKTDLFKLDNNRKGAFHHLVDKRKKKTGFTEDDVSIVRFLAPKMDQSLADSFLNYAKAKYIKRAIPININMNSASRLFNTSMRSIRSRVDSRLRKQTTSSTRSRTNSASSDIPFDQIIDILDEQAQGSTITI